MIISFQQIKQLSQMGKLNVSIILLLFQHFPERPMRYSKNNEANYHFFLRLILWQYYATISSSSEK